MIFGFFDLADAVNIEQTRRIHFLARTVEDDLVVFITDRSCQAVFHFRNHFRITTQFFDQFTDIWRVIGFIRINDGSNPFDKTSIHPESYDKTLELLKSIDCTLDDIGTDKLKSKLDNYDVENSNLEIDKYTLEDIIKSLIKPNRDPRDDMPKPILKSDVLTVEDLHIGDKLQGTVRNVAPFGLFIDIGLHNDGLAHISKLSKDYIKDPNDMFSVGDIVDCYVIDIKKDTEKVSLSLIEE